MLQVLTEAQRDALLSAPDWRTPKGRRDRAFLAIMAYAGLRIGEVRGLTKDNIREDGGVTRLTFTGKGGKTRTVTLPPNAVHALKNYQKGIQTPLYIFPGRYGHSGLSKRASFNIVRDAVAEAGLPEWVHPHSLRHTFATMLQRKTGDLFLTQNVLGHSSPMTTARYYLAFDARSADRAAEAFK